MADTPKPWDRMDIEEKLEYLHEQDRIHDQKILRNSGAIAQVNQNLERHRHDTQGTACLPIERIR